MDDLICFAAVEFPEDPNVAGISYWYVCPFDGAEVGDIVVAPLGRHNKVQTGIIRKIMWADEWEAPFPMYLIKNIRELIKSKKEL